MVNLPMPVKLPIPCRIVEQPIWHRYTFTPDAAGNYSGSMIFFHTNIKNNTDSNVYNGCLPPSHWFRVKKLSLSSDANTSFQNLVSGSHFSFVLGMTSYLSGPAEMLLRGNVQEFNRIVDSLKKLSKADQVSILKNLKIAEGKVFENPLDILDLQQFRLEFHTPQPVKLKKPVTVQCTLDGTYYRPLLA